MHDPGKKPLDMPPPARAVNRKLRFDAPHPIPARPPHRPLTPPNK